MVLCLLFFIRAQNKTLQGCRAQCLHGTLATHIHKQVQHALSCGVVLCYNRPCGVLLDRSSWARPRGLGAHGRVQKRHGDAEDSERLFFIAGFEITPK